jgi:seryl-tRNA synthetase
LKELTALDELRRELRFEAEKLRSEQKTLGKQIASADEKTKNELLDQASQMSEKVKDLFEKVDVADKNFMDIWIKIPNLISTTSPDGTSDKENSEIKKCGEIRILIILKTILK